MENIIERVAHFANIDTRRTLGFPPRRLPTSDIHIPLKRFTPSRTYVVLGNGRQLTVWREQEATVWSTGLTGPLRAQRDYCFIRETGCVRTYEGLQRIVSCHPDLNEDGSFRRSTQA